MSFEIEITKRFEKELKKLCKKYISLKSEYKELIEKLSNDPKTGTALGNNVSKSEFLLVLSKKVNLEEPE